MEQETGKKIRCRIPAWIVSIAGTLGLGTAFVLWLIGERPAAAGAIAAACSLVLFVIGCIRFVPGFLAFFTERDDTLSDDPEPKHILPAVAALAFAVEVLLFGIAALALFLRNGSGFTLRSTVEIWRSLDSAHYLDIMREWYIDDGDWGRVVQLVFLPGYPLAVYPFYRILGSDIGAGILVSSAAFPAACCVLYRLLRLDWDHKRAFRTVLMLFLLPGGFFFIAPMSESLYLLLALSALYCLRRKRYLLAGLFGAYCAFTRTVGLLLLAPVVLEWIRSFPKERTERGKWACGILTILLIPVGFAAYLWINKTVSGNPLQFLIYQRDHWSQQLGWFFGTAAYQTKYLLGCLEDGNRSNFLGLWLPNLLWHFGTLGLFAYASKKLRPGYAAWFIAYFAIAIGTTWLLSGPRYLLAMPVVAMMLALVTEKRWQQWLAALVLVPLSILYLIAFICRWQVW
ncbi:MAG: hypothetical protein IJL62_05315 [Clostridia bacterium]|nr:hypothetical protein [Clostridia bacterium]